MRRTKSKYHQSVVNNNLGNPEKFWKTIKELYPNKSTSNNIKSSSFNSDELSTSDKGTIANGFNKFFTSVASNLKAKSIFFERLREKIDLLSN